MRTQPLISVGCFVHYWVSCAINKWGFWACIFVSTHICLALGCLLTFCLTLMHQLTCWFVCPQRSSSKLLLRSAILSLLSVHLLKVCSWTFAKRTYFKSLLKVNYRSVFAKSFKAFIFQKFRQPLCHKVNLPSCVHVAWRSLCHKVNIPRCEAQRRHFFMTCDVFGTGQMNILGLCYSVYIRKNL